MISLLLIRKIVQLFFIMLLGYILVKLKVVKSEESVVLSKLSLYLITPCVIINAFQVDFKNDVRQGLLLALIVSVIIHILLIIIAYLIKNIFKLEEVEIASIIYSNAGNLIIPIVTSVLGAKWVIYSSAFISVQLVFLWTHCKVMFSKEEKLYIRKIILNVNMLSIFCGVFLLISGVRLPGIIHEAMSSVGDMIGPVAMLVTGMIIAGMPFKQFFVHKKIYLVTFFRMIFCPAVIIMLLKFSNAASLVHNGKEILLITFLATATPAASTVTQFAQIYNKDAEYAGAINIMTTILCIVTMPVFVTLYYL
ncbi:MULTISPECIES: AEC family transporter [Clostridium]|uniref:AEC family transporter n=1 Tax=Clostridium TaxID=1485 RepID=UPI0008261CF5|nr:MULTISPECIES: AEC family transporter [Clostridium]PJI06972.1 autotransporter [Clostridium sp. CT7]